MKTSQSLSKAATLWNKHTNPSILRSDFEHLINGKAARKISKWIKRHFQEGVDFTYSKHSGKLIPTHHQIYVDER